MKELINRITQKIKAKREQRENAKDVIDPNHILLSGELPLVGSIYKWVEPVCITLGRVVSAQPDRIVFTPFTDEPNAVEKEFELYMENGILYYKSTRSNHELPTISLIVPSDTVKRQFEFYTTTEEKSAILQAMIDYQEKVIIPEKEKELNFYKERVNLYVSLKEESQA